MSLSAGKLACGYTAWKVSNTEFFLIRISPYSDWIRTRKNSVFGHFSRSVSVWATQYPNILNRNGSFSVQAEFSLKTESFHF